MARFFKCDWCKNPFPIDQVKTTFVNADFSGYKGDLKFDAELDLCPECANKLLEMKKDS